MLVILLSVGAACCLGFGFVFQQDAARRAPLSDFLSPRLLLDLMRVPSWLAGLGLMVCGMVLGALALGQGEVSVVEPLLATNLLFAMALSRHRTGQSLGRQGWGGLCLLAGGVTAFLLAGEPQGGEAETSSLRQWLVIGVVAGLALVLTACARHPRTRGTPVYLGLAAGLLYGLQDALTRLSGERLTADGWDALLTSWYPYAVLFLGVTGLLLVQSAFEAGPLRMSLAGADRRAAAVGDPLRDRVPRRPGADRHRRPGLAGGGARGDRGRDRAAGAAPGDAGGEGPARINGRGPVDVGWAP